MLYWLLERLLRRGFRSRKGILGMGQMENLARSGTAVWVLTQEKARQDYLLAKEAYVQNPSWRSFELMMERLLQLHSTNAVIQSLINEHMLNQLLVNQLKDAPSPEMASARRCA